MVSVARRSRARARAALGVGALVACLVTAALPAAGLARSPAPGSSAPGIEASTAAAPAGLTRPGECAGVVPLASVRRGQVGTGWTVVRGTVPRPFRVEILGIFRDGILPGRDMILVKVGDLPGRNVVGVAGGIWSGMSGSPVYLGDRLVGAVAYGFSVGPSRIGGLTPAEDMQRLSTIGSATSQRVSRERVRLSPSLRGTLRGLAPTGVGPEGFDRLPLPLTVSGLSGRGLSMLRERFADAGLPTLLVRGSAAAAPTGTDELARPVPGGNFAGVISYGDVSIAGVGTTTWVCGDQAIAFGHPLSLSGRSTAGANGARSLAIVDDPTATPYKLATIGRPFGSLDQDRLAGVRADLGRLPAMIPVTARVEDRDLGRTRTGRTDVTNSAWVPAVVGQHLYYDLISVTDREGPGTAGLTFEVSGRRANGAPWTVVVQDRLASTGSVQLEAARALDALVSTIAGNPFEPVTFTRVAARATVKERVATLSIVRVLVSRNGATFRDLDELRVRSGDALALRVVLRSPDDTRRTIRLALAVPVDAAGFGLLSVSGGSSEFDPCEFDPSECPVRSFPGLLRYLRDAPKGNEVNAELFFASGGGTTPGQSDRQRVDSIVDGERLIGIEVR